MSPLNGVTFLDHTADVGIAVEAPDLATLFHRAALGMLALLRGDDDAEESRGSSGASGDPATELLDLEAAGPVPLLADWLRELLFLHETAGRDYVGARFERLDDRSLRARVAFEPAAPAVREIKGVTYHELHVGRTDAGWEGQVIFDV